MAWPVAVVVDTNTRWPGSRAFSGPTSARAAMASPTETAWIQMAGPDAAGRRSAAPPMRSPRLPRYRPVPRPFQR